MRNSRKHPSTLRLAVVCLVSVLAQGCAFGPGGGRGELLDQWEKSEAGLTVRVREFQEKNPVYLTNFFYVFDSYNAEVGKWQEFMEVKNDDDVLFPRNQIRVMTNKVGYAFMNNNYAVTIDGGRSWTVWEAKPANLSKLQHAASIRAVELNSDGSGKMQLETTLDGQEASLTISTQDYGQHWNFK